MEEWTPRRRKKSRNATKLEGIVSLCVAFLWHFVSSKSRNENILANACYFFLLFIIYRFNSILYFFSIFKNFSPHIWFVNIYHILLKICITVFAQKEFFITLSDANWGLSKISVFPYVDAEIWNTHSTVMHCKPSHLRNLLVMEILASNFAAISYADITIPFQSHFITTHLHILTLLLIQSSFSLFTCIFLSHVSLIPCSRELFYRYLYSVLLYLPFLCYLHFFLIYFDLEKNIIFL